LSPSRFIESLKGRYLVPCEILAGPESSSSNCEPESSPDDTVCRFARAGDAVETARRVCGRSSRLSPPGQYTAVFGGFMNTAAAIVFAALRLRGKTYSAPA